MKNYICPQCLFFFEKNNGMCPCSRDYIKPAFIVKLDIFLIYTNLICFKHCLKTSKLFESYKEIVSKNLEALIILKQQRRNKLIKKFGIIQEDR